MLFILLSLITVFWFVIATILNRLQILQDPNSLPYSAHAEAAEWVTDNGISDGTRPTLPASRQQVWQMIKNYDEM